MVRKRLGDVCWNDCDCCVFHVLHVSVPAGETRSLPASGCSSEHTSPLQVHGQNDRLLWQGAALENDVCAEWNRKGTSLHVCRPFVH